MGAPLTSTQEWLCAPLRTSDGRRTPLAGTLDTGRHICCQINDPTNS